MQFLPSLLTFYYFGLNDHKDIDKEAYGFYRMLSSRNKLIIYSIYESFEFSFQD